MVKLCMPIIIKVVFEYNMTEGLYYYVWTAFSNMFAQSIAIFRSFNQLYVTQNSDLWFNISVTFQAAYEDKKLVVKPGFFI